MEWAVFDCVKCGCNWRVSLAEKAGEESCPGCEQLAPAPLWVVGDDEAQRIQTREEVKGDAEMGDDLE